MLEVKERELLESLSKTLNKHSFAMQDLSLKSIVLTNVLNPRNPILPDKKNAYDHIK